ncbi:MAG: sigma-70 family RNA polymerase sigma factor [Paludibacteraceae bacterium]|nr:sigma-70 family RNA polymerase sigma factor [Paludibacteraceae bacterium]
MGLQESELTQQLKDESTQAQAFTILVKQYQEQVYWLIRKMVLSHDDANDVLQNTLLHAWNGIKSFRGDAKFSTWLYRIAVNETFTFLANAELKNANTMTDLEDVMVQNLASDEYFEGDEAQIKLQKAILSLPPKQRMVFNMKYFEDKKYEEMEEILGTSVGALKASYHHAVKKIENFILMED